MKRRQVWRYECEFCGKSNCSASSISRHENRCTKNPNRICGVCNRLIGEIQPNLKDLQKLLPSEQWYVETSPEGCDLYDAYDEDVLNAAFEKIFEAAHGCPACTAAAMRQAGIPLQAVTDFHWKEIMTNLWADVNAEQAKYERSWEP